MRPGQSPMSAQSRSLSSRGVRARTLISPSRRTLPIQAVHEYITTASSSRLLSPRPGLGRPSRPVSGNALQRILLQPEHVLGHDAIGPLAGRCLAVELLVGESDE